MPLTEEEEKELKEEQEMQTLLYNTRVNQNMLIALSVLYSLLIIAVIVISIVGFFKMRKVEETVISRVGNVAQKSLPGLLGQVKSFAKSFMDMKK